MHPLPARDSKRELVQPDDAIARAALEAVVSSDVAGVWGGAVVLDPPRVALPTILRMRDATGAP